MLHGGERNETLKHIETYAFLIISGCLVQFSRWCHLDPFGTFQVAGNLQQVPALLLRQLQLPGQFCVAA